MNALYVAEFRPEGCKEWRSMLTFKRPSGALWVGDSRELIQASVELYGFKTNDYRVVEYRRVEE